MTTFEASPVEIPDVQAPKSGPLKVALVVTLVSALLAYTQIRSHDFLLISIVGYLLTPFAVVACLVRARKDDLLASANAYYDRSLGGFAFLGKTFVKRLQLITLLAFLVGIVHIWTIATAVSIK